MKSKLIPLKLSQALAGFYLTQHARRLSVHTIADYSNTLTKFRSFMEKDLFVEEITAQHIEAFLATQTTVSKKTLLNYWTGLSALWTWAVKEQVASVQIVRTVEAPRPEHREIVPYSEAEIKLMLNNLNRSKAYTRPGQGVQDRGLLYPERNRAIILVLLDTGIRAEELCSLKIHQLDKRNQRIRVFGKGAKERYVSFSPRTHQALWRYLAIRPEGMEEGDPLFANSNGRVIKRRRLLSILQNIGERAGVPDVTVHRFRHTFAIQYLRNRGDPYTLQRMLGHSDLSMIRRYLAIAQSDIEAAHKLASPVSNWAL